MQAPDQNRLNVSLIMARSRNHVIGLNRRLPWRLPSDLLRFRQHTWMKPVIMGRRTYESLKEPLLMRTNIVVSHTLTRSTILPGFIHARSIMKALEIARTDWLNGISHEVMVIGGEDIFNEFIKMYRPFRVYLTHVHADIEPLMERDVLIKFKYDFSDWYVEHMEHHQSEGDQHPYTFAVLKMHGDDLNKWGIE